jgi:uncharacterized membrane protein
MPQVARPTDNADHAARSRAEPSAGAPADHKDGPEDAAMSDRRWRRPARRVWDSLWFVPTLYVLVALGLSVGLMRWDETSPITLARSINGSSATAAMSALGSGMLAFTGFVTSVILLVIQFGSSQFSPRFVAWFRRDPTLKFALSTFSATFIFALVSTAQIGRGTASFVPTRTLLAALALTLLSMGMFLVLIDRTSNGLRVAFGVQGVDSEARQAFDAVYPDGTAGTEAGQDAVRSLRGRTPVQTVRQGPVGTVVVALDRTGLAGLAEQHDALIELARAPGDHVPAGGALVHVYGPRPLPERRLLRRIVLGDERTIDDDPAFALRMLVDVGIKALSPAVNDPTTAVQSLDRIEDLLRYAAAKHLSIGIVTDRQGAVRLVYPTPTWDDLVELGLDEIRAFGAGQYQVARRLRALLDTLLTELPEKRRPPLVAQRRLLDDAVASAIPENQRADALIPDRQGIGMSHGPRPDRQ